MLIQRVWQILDVAPENDRVSQAESIFMFCLILLNAASIILETVQSIKERYMLWFETLETISVVLFTLEYLGRLWSCVVVPEYASPLVGRLRFALTPGSLIDLISILPFYLSLANLDLRILWMLRFLRLFRLLKLERYSVAISLLGGTIRSRRAELLATGLLMSLVLIIASTLMFFAEHEAQPDKFPDIPTAMWWAVITLTTIGYGDVFPITAIGKVIASLIAILGIGFVALPTGIISVGFVEELRNFKESLKQKSSSSSPESFKCVCPHCGKEIEISVHSRAEESH